MPTESKMEHPVQIGMRKDVETTSFCLKPSSANREIPTIVHQKLVDFGLNLCDTLAGGIFSYVFN